jgi:hypothetical protein
MGLADFMINVIVSSTSITSYSSVVSVIISSSSLNHLTLGLGLPPDILTVNLASWFSLTVTFSSLPLIFGVS